MKKTTQESFQQILPEEYFLLNFRKAPTLKEKTTFTSNPIQLISSYFLKSVTKTFDHKPCDYRVS
jgi:hypothetical protein